DGGWERRASPLSPALLFVLHPYSPARKWGTGPESPAAGYRPIFAKRQGVEETQFSSAVDEAGAGVARPARDIWSYQVTCVLRLFTYAPLTSVLSISLCTHAYCTHHALETYTLLLDTIDLLASIFGARNPRTTWSNQAIYWSFHRAVSSWLLAIQSILRSTVGVYLLI